MKNRIIKHQPALGIRLDRRITIKSLDSTQDEYGAPNAEAWTTFATVWASIEDINGKEYIAAAAVQNTSTTNITIRYIRGVQPKMRVFYNMDFYDIDAVLGQDYSTITLMCTRGIQN